MCINAMLECRLLSFLYNAYLQNKNEAGPTFNRDTIYNVGLMSIH